MKMMFELVSKIQEHVPYELKHASIVNGLIKLNKPWGIDSGLYPAPNFSNRLTAVFSLSRLLGKGIKGQIIYGFRNKTSTYDGKLFLEFDSEKIDYTSFVFSIFNSYVEVFDPIQASVYNEETLYYDYQNRDTIIKSGRTFTRFHPVFFWTEEYCQTALNIPLIELKARLENYVEYLDWGEKGLFIVVTSKILNLDELNALNSKMMDLLLV